MGNLHGIVKQDLFRLKFITEAHFSPDGKQVLYGISSVDADKDEERVHLWLVSSEGGEPRHLTSGNGRNYGANWSPDGKRIAFLSTRVGAPQVFIIPVAGGEAVQLTSLKFGVGSAPLWSPDGSTIAFTAASITEMPDYSKPYRITRSIYRLDGVGFLDPIIQDIYVIPAEGGEPQQLTQDFYMNSGLHWSPDGQDILYSYQLGPDTLKFFSKGLRLVNMQGEINEVVELDWGFVVSSAWNPDGEKIVFTGVEADKPTGHKHDLWMVSRQGGKPENRTAEFASGVGGGLQLDMPVMFNPILHIPKNEHCVFANVHQGGCVGVYEIALDGPGSCKAVLGGERQAVLVDASNRNMLLHVTSLNDPTNLVLCSLDNLKERQITAVNQDTLAGWKLPDVEHLVFPGANNELVEGWYMKPTTDTKAPYPTIVYVHGGPHGAFGYGFSFDFHMLAGAGYGVLFANPHGSTGYGSAFAASIQGDLGNLDFKDVMAGLDYVVEKGWADSEKLGICGLSYGGFMTCWAVGHTDRFKAAVAENPVTNQVSSYGVADIIAGMVENLLGGKPHEKPEVYSRCSPITYAHHCKTPTLLVQGESDYRCPAEQSEQFYTVLKANGCIVEMLRLPGSSHAGSIFGTPLVRKAQNEALLDWLDRYVLGNTG